MNLTNEDNKILNGEHGIALQKAMKSIVMYGDIMGADRLVPVTNNAHLAISAGSGFLKPYIDIIRELVESGFRLEKSFTVDPNPIDVENMSLSFLQRFVSKLITNRQKEFEDILLKIGLKNDKAFTCACYLKEVGNTPNFRDILSWSESSAVVYANSVIGARTNRNSAGIDLLCSIIGKVPNFDLLTDEGRMAKWVIEIKTKKTPNAQLLGGAIGFKVVEDVPYITGLDKLIGTELNQKTKDYLKDMGAAAASNGAVGLYHVENLTPEAVKSSRALIAKEHKTYVIDDAELERIMNSYPVMWNNPDSKPKKCFIGCPHLSLEQLCDWVENIDKELEKAHQKTAKLDTVLCTAPDVIDVFNNKTELVAIQKKRGIRISGTCGLMLMGNPLINRIPAVTNSNKLRTYTPMRFYHDVDILKIICSGNLPDKKLL